MEDFVWCEDCTYFVNQDIGGEGWCDVYDKSTWYGNSYAMDCLYLKEKRNEAGLCEFGSRSTYI